MTARFLISGRVQGVGFRHFVIVKAKMLGLAGLVRNLPDGRVEVYLDGEEDTVETMRRLCQKGPAFSRVNEVEVVQNTPYPANRLPYIGF